MTTDRFDALVAAHGPTYRSSGGLLLAAVERHEHVEPEWISVVVGDLVVQVSHDALRAPIDEAEMALRLPVSYEETIAICCALDCLPPTAAISDAIWAQSPVRIVPKPLVFTADDAAKMNTVEWTLRHNCAVESQIRGATSELLIADVGKDWILDNGLSVKGAVNYGWRTSSTHMYQPIGHGHDPKHWDYSQVLRLVRREALLNGQSADLADVLLREVEAKWLAPYR